MDQETDGPGPDWKGLDWTEPMKNLAISALKMAADDGLILDYKFPTDTRAAQQVERLRRNLGEGIPLPPDDSGFYYLIHMAGPPGVGGRHKVVYGEDEVCPAMFTLALAMRGPEYARKFEYRRGQLS